MAPARDGGVNCDAPRGGFLERRRSPDLGANRGRDCTFDGVHLSDFVRSSDFVRLSDLPVRPTLSVRPTLPVRPTSSVGPTASRAPRTRAIADGRGTRPARRTWATTGDEPPPDPARHQSPRDRSPRDRIDPDYPRRVAHPPRPRRPRENPTTRRAAQSPRARRMMASTRRNRPPRATRRRNVVRDRGPAERESRGWMERRLGNAGFMDRRRVFWSPRSVRVFGGSAFGTKSA